VQPSQSLCVLYSSCYACRSPQVTLSDVRAAWSGIRPLIKDPAKLASGSTTAQLSRKVRG